MRPIHPNTSARRELTNRGRLATEGDGQFGQRHVEDVVEKESGPLQRGQTLKGQHQRDRDVVGDCLRPAPWNPREDPAAMVRRRFPGAPARSGVGRGTAVGQRGLDGREANRRHFRWSRCHACCGEVS